MNLQKHEEEHLQKIYPIAAECTVLLKYNGSFPLKNAGPIALYGNGARHTIKGGTGSGEVNSRFYTTCEQGLEKAGFTITTKKWLDDYDIIQNQAKRRFVEEIKVKSKELKVSPIILGMGAVMKEPDYELPIEKECENAVYVLSRICGEGNDRKPEAGDFKLTETEIRDILTCYRRYSNFILVLNVGSVIDLTPVLEVENILLLSQLGAVTGDILADILLGKSYPSGKLTDTWTSWEDYPSIGEFGEHNDTHYNEGIYVGYRYFDSVNMPVLFPFGYGLGYTRFKVDSISASMEGSVLTVSAKVTNIGNYSGKEVIQLYVTAPWGKLDHPYQSLCGFIKTEELAPDASQFVTISIKMEDLSSFDTERAAYILENGKYLFRIGVSSRDSIPCAAVYVPQEVIVRQLSNVIPAAGFIDWKPEFTWGEDFADVPTFTCCKFETAAVVPNMPSSKAMEMVKRLSDEELCSLCIGKFKRSIGGNSVIGNASNHVAGAAGESYDGVAGVRGLIMADGPAGLRLSPMYTKDKKGAHPIGESIPATIVDFIPPIVAKLSQLKNRRKQKDVVYYQYCTAIPIGTAIAQSWNPQVAFTCGDVVGAEMELFGVDLWLAPACNIHRNPLCGRNFEYYSEDPLISGIFAKAMTEGVQKHPRKGVTVKHFCVNNQESNRYQNNSVLNERALREIYLKAFEICIMQAKPKTIMTSYNLLNGTHTAEHAGILKTVLRKEWGFQGLVMTDWIIAEFKDEHSTYRTTQIAPSISAGNDLFMPGSQNNYRQLLSALKKTNKDFLVNREAVETCAAHLVDLIQSM